MTLIIDKCVNVFLSADDLSFNAIATQSTTQAGPQIMYGASNAVDRNTATCMRTQQIGLTSPDKVVWWKVDLGETSNIQSINILFKNYENYGMYHFDCIFFAEFVQDQLLINNRREKKNNFGSLQVN